MGNSLKVKFEQLPQAGETYNDSGFEYEVVNSRPHTNRDGAPSMLIEWRGVCAEEGCAIHFKTGPSIYSFPRRCKAHNMGWKRAVPWGSEAAPPAISPGRKHAMRDINVFVNGFCDYMALMEGAGWRATQDNLLDYFDRQFPEWNGGA